MAGRKIENAAIGAEDWTSEVESKNLLKKGYYNLSFTNMDNTSQPAIAAGSSVDIDGVIYVFDTEEAISGSPSDGVVYVTISGGVAATASFTNTALPEYDYLKNGYYGAGGERYVLEMHKNATNYFNKFYIKSEFYSSGYIYVYDSDVDFYTRTQTYGYFNSLVTQLNTNYGSILANPIPNPGSVTDAYSKQNLIDYFEKLIFDINSSFGSGFMNNPVTGTISGKDPTVTPVGVTSGCFSKYNEAAFYNNFLYFQEQLNPGMFTWVRPTDSAEPYGYLPYKIPNYFTTTV
jgi:hypothetical protein